MKISAAVVFSVIILISACSKTTDTVNNNPPPPDNPNPPINPLPDSTKNPLVYIGGQGRGSGSAQFPRFWKNNVMSTIGDTATNQNDVTGFKVAGTDIYISGTTWSSGLSKAVYWKNGNKIILSDSTSSTTGIFISGSDVYVSGFIYLVSTPGKWLARIWKNGTPYDLNGNGSKTAYATGVAVSGNDVFASGIRNNPDSVNPIYMACYWKNGVLTDLTDGRLEGSTSCVVVSSNDVYIGGYQASPVKAAATYWKNGQAFKLEDGSTPSVIKKIFIYGGDVYAAGSKGLVGGSTVATYWKNGVLTTLGDPNFTYSIANDIVVNDHDVYVVGQENFYARYWKNGIATFLQPVMLNDNAFGIALLAN